jgi:hypothetical protein
MLVAIASLTLVAAVTPTSPAPVPTSVAAELILASSVVNRQAQPVPEELLAGHTVYAFTEITGPGGGFVEHVWSRDGKEVARHYLPVGQSKRWRTWSRHTLAAGEYRVQVLGKDGKQLQEMSFQVLPMVED